MQFTWFDYTAGVLFYLLLAGYMIGRGHHLWINRGFRRGFVYAFAGVVVGLAAPATLFLWK